NIVISNFNDGDKTERQRRQINSPPQDIVLNMFHPIVPENVRDFDIASVNVLDDEKDEYTCSVSTHNTSDGRQPFEIDHKILRTSLDIQNNLCDLDYETVGIYNITVTCIDLIHHFTIIKNFSIEVSDVNEAPVQLTLVSNILPENSPVDYVIGQFRTLDPDLPSLNQTFKYSLITDSKHIFKIKNDQLILTRENDVQTCISQPDTCPHDYEQISSVLIRVLVEDNGTPRASQRFWIQVMVTDENDPPVDLQLNQNTVKENSPIGTLIGTFSVEDQDLYQNHSFMLVHQSSSFKNQSIFEIENNELRLLQSPDYEQDQFHLITVRATDNATSPLSVIGEFIIEILDVNEFPSTYAFIANVDTPVTNETKNNLINGVQPVRTVYLPQNAYFQAKLGRIVFIMQDRDRDLLLKGTSDFTEFGFSTPTCEILSQNPYRALCTSIVSVENRYEYAEDKSFTDHLVVTPLILTSNLETMTFPRILRVKFENITLTIDDERRDSIDILGVNSAGKRIGKLGAIDLASNSNSIEKISLNLDNSSLFPFELTDDNILQIRNDVNLTSSNYPSKFNVSVLITTNNEGENRTIETFFNINIREKDEFILNLSNNKILENAREDNFIGLFTFDNGTGDYTLELVDNANGRFKLNGTSLYTDKTSVKYCHLNHTCPLDYEDYPTINITVAVLDPSTDEILRRIVFCIEIQDENEAPHNLTLSTTSLYENATVGSLIATISALDDDANQTLTYLTSNPLFTIRNNELILNKALDHNLRETISVYIRATDDGQPPTFTEKLFLINVVPINRPLVNVTSTPMIYYMSNNTNPTATIVGQILIVDPDENESFDITFDKTNFQASTAAANPYSLILDDGSLVYAQLYNITVIDMEPPTGQANSTSSTNVTTTIRDSANHTVTYAFTVQYLSRSAQNLTTTTALPSTTTTAPSLSQIMHVRIYETALSGTPIVRSILNTTTTNHTPICTVTDENNIQFPINASQTSSIIYLPENYTLNSTDKSNIFLDVQCVLSNGADIDEGIVIDVLPAPPTVQIKFNQTDTFYATNNINNQTILGQFYPIELTTKPTNRTFNLSLTNYQDIFQLLPNDSLIQIGPYPTNIVASSSPTINLTIQAAETTPNEPVRIIQNTFTIPIVLNLTIPVIAFNRTTIPFNINPNTTIGLFTIYNSSTTYRLHLLDSYNDSLELDPDTKLLTIKQTLDRVPLENNRTQLFIKVALVDSTNETILSSTFYLTITNSSGTDPCENKDCGYGTCVTINQTLSYCLCTSGYTGLDCRTVDSCTYNPCLNNGICHQLSTQGDFSCTCLPNHSGSLCEININVCELNSSLCLSTEICIPINNNLTNFYRCFPRDELLYFVFDYLNHPDAFDAINVDNLTTKIKEFLQLRVTGIENISILERQVLGPLKYNRAELISIAMKISNENYTILSEVLDDLCADQSVKLDVFNRELCIGYQQAHQLTNRFKSLPDVCPNCTFTDAANEYYWFDKTLPFLPLWITLIVGSILMAMLSLIPFDLNAPSKVALPLMKARVYPEQGENLDEENPVSKDSVRLAGKFSRERNDSGYESNEENETYLDEIITNHQRNSTFYVYPVIHGPRSPARGRRGTTIDDLLSSNATSRSRSISSASLPRQQIQRSVSMSTQRIDDPSSARSSETLKPIIQRRSLIDESSIGTLIGLLGTPRLNPTDDTYVSTTFRNENTSKFVIGTLWNTFALVNNLFLQRPRKRRNALSGNFNIHADELAHLEALYSLAEREQANQFSITHLQSIIGEALQTSDTHRTRHLQAMLFDILSSKKENPCNCYGNHHVPSCVYYDHSLPYLRNSQEQTSSLENILRDIHKSSKPRRQDAATQSLLDKPRQSFTQLKTTTNVSTQSSPMVTMKQIHYHVSTQYSPINQENNFNASTQTKNNDLLDASTQFSPRKSDQIAPVYVNVSKSLRPAETKKTRSNSIPNHQNDLLSELKEVFSTSTNPEPNSNHSVRSLVSIFEANKSPKSFPSKSISASNVKIEQYANEVASNIVENAVEAATITLTNISDHQSQRRFSVYKNAGEHGKSLLFQSNTFVPPIEDPKEKFDETSRASIQPPSVFITPPQSQHTLIVGRHINGDDSKAHFDMHYDSSSLSSLDDEQVNPQQFLSNSQLFSAQELYIRPWLVRRATAPNIHCLDNDINDTHIETNHSSLNEMNFNVFPNHSNMDLYTRYSCLITILLYLRDVHDQYSNEILYNELNHIEQQFQSPTFPCPTMQSNTFETINPDGSKRYRTGFVVDVNSIDSPMTRPKILSNQVDWKRVKLVTRRFRKKYQHYKQLIKNDQLNKSNNRSTIDHYLKAFDSTSRRRMKKYAKHYAEKL
ncbi:unnamed protein product, partial [Adineta ricciae]